MGRERPNKKQKIIQNWGCRRAAKENSQGKYSMVSVKEILMYFKVVKGVSGTRRVKKAIALGPKIQEGGRGTVSNPRNLITTHTQGSKSPIQETWSFP